MSEQPSDPRRRRQPADRPEAVTDQGPQAGSVESSLEPGEEPALTRTLFSFFEPVLNVIGSFSLPIVIAGVVGIVAGAVVLAFVSSMRDPYGWIVLWFSIGLIAVVALNSFSTVAAAFISRTGRYGVNTLIMTAAFTGIVVVIGVISFENNKRMDVTATNQFSLHNRTKDLLKNLEEPVRATAFYKVNVSPDPVSIVGRARVEETFRDFKAARSSKFSYEFKDPDLEPDVIRNFFGEIPVAFVNETIVVEGLNSGKIQVIEPSARSYDKLEQELATSILVVSGQERKTVYFLAGHGERSINSAVGEGYASLRTLLEADNYRVRTLRWDPSAEEVSVPEEEPGTECAESDEGCLHTAGLLVIAKPSGELPEAHARALDLYLQGVKEKKDDEGNVSLVARSEAGRIIFLIESDTPDSFQLFLARWGVVLGSGYILDEARHPKSQPRTLQLEAITLKDLPPELIEQAPAELLKPLLGITTPKGEPLGPTYMPGAVPLLAAPLQLSPERRLLRLPVELAFTSNTSYLIDDIEREEPIKDGDENSDPQPDPRGPFSPVVYVQALAPIGQPPLPTQSGDNKQPRLIVFGDSDFIANSSLDTGRGSGADFFLNSANYLLGDFSLESIRPKAITFRELNLNRNEERFVRWTSWLFLPGLLGLMAALVWWMRR